MGFLSEHVCAALLVCVWLFRRTRRFAQGTDDSCSVLAEANTTLGLCKDDALGPTAIRRVQSPVSHGRQQLSLSTAAATGYMHPILPLPQRCSGTGKGSSAAEKTPLPQPRSLPGCCHLTEGLALAPETRLDWGSQICCQAHPVFTWKEKKGEERDMLHPH